VLFECFRTGYRNLQSGSDDSSEYCLFHSASSAIQTVVWISLDWSHLSCVAYRCIHLFSIGSNSILIYSYPDFAVFRWQWPGNLLHDHVLLFVPSGYWIIYPKDIPSEFPPIHTLQNHAITSGLKFVCNNQISGCFRRKSDLKTSGCTGLDQEMSPQWSIHDENDYWNTIPHLIANSSVWMPDTPSARLCILSVLPIDSSPIWSDATSISLS
jgi:hypothetical protein